MGVEEEDGVEREEWEVEADLGGALDLVNDEDGAGLVADTACSASVSVSWLAVGLVNVRAASWSAPLLSLPSSVVEEGEDDEDLTEEAVGGELLEDGEDFGCLLSSVAVACCGNRCCCR